MTSVIPVSAFVTYADFDAFKKEITERVETDEQLSDLRMRKITAIVNKNMAGISSAVAKIAENNGHEFDLLNERFNSINERINNLNSKLEATNDKIAATNEHINHLEKFFDEKIEHVTDTLIVAVNGVNQRIDDIKTEQNKSIAKWGIFITVAIGLFQAVVSIALHFLV